MTEAKQKEVMDSLTSLINQEKKREDLNSDILSQIDKLNFKNGENKCQILYNSSLKLGQL